MILCRYNNEVFLIYLVWPCLTQGQRNRASNVNRTLYTRLMADTLCHIL